MPKVLSAKDYGFRKVIKVVMNPDEPKWVHLDAGGNKTPAPDGHTGNTDEGLAACSDCKMNHVVSEHIWEGDQLTYTDDSGTLKPKPQYMILEELKAIVAKAVSSQSPPNLSSIERATL